MTLRTSSDSSAIELLKGHDGVSNIEVAGTALRISLRQADFDYDRSVGSVVRSLVEAGIDVYEISQERVSLESRFFEVTSEGDEVTVGL